jgi:hypothetical protein
MIPRLSVFLGSDMNEKAKAAISEQREQPCRLVAHRMIDRLLRFVGTEIFYGRPKRERNVVDVGQRGAHFTGQDNHVEGYPGAELAKSQHKSCCPAINCAGAILFLICYGYFARAQHGSASHPTLLLKANSLEADIYMPYFRDLDIPHGSPGRCTA